MRSGFNKITAVLVAGAFALAAVLCCLNHPLAGPQAPVHSCCAGKAKHAPAPTADCSACPIVKKSVDVAPLFVFSPPLAAGLPVFAAYALTARPARSVVTVFANGPPGPRAAIPLYLRFRSLRI